MTLLVAGHETTASQLGDFVYTPATHPGRLGADRLDVTRTDNPHVAFGPGVHHCLGAQPARLEPAEALTAILARLPGLRLAAPEDELPWKIGLRVRGLCAHPVTWDTATGCGTV